jgi:multiple sugar transport system substrate-binding protein
MQNHRQKGIDTSAFLTMSLSQTFPPPIVDKASQINEVVGHSMESILMRSNNAKDALESANLRLKQLLRK